MRKFAASRKRPRRRRIFPSFSCAISLIHTRKSSHFSRREFLRTYSRRPVLTAHRRWKKAGSAFRGGPRNRPRIRVARFRPLDTRVTALPVTLTPNTSANSHENHQKPAKISAIATKSTSSLAERSHTSERERVVAGRFRQQQQQRLASHSNQRFAGL